MNQWKYPSGQLYLLGLIKTILLEDRNKSFWMYRPEPERETCVWVQQPADHMLLLSPPMEQPQRVQQPAPVTRTASRAPMTSNNFRLLFSIIWPANIHQFLTVHTHPSRFYSQSLSVALDVQGLPKTSLKVWSVTEQHELKLHSELLSLTKLCVILTFRKVNLKWLFLLWKGDLASMLISFSSLKSM